MSKFKPYTVRISAVESVQVERTDKTVKLTLTIGLAPVLTKHLPADAARLLGDALGFCANDVAWPA